MGCRGSKTLAGCVQDKHSANCTIVQLLPSIFAFYINVLSTFMSGNSPLHIYNKCRVILPQVYKGICFKAFKKGGSSGGEREKFTLLLLLVDT